MAGKCSRNVLKVGMRSYYSVGRPPAKFHRIWSPFDAPTNNYSGNSSRSIVGRFWSPETVTGPLSLFSPLCPRPSTQPTRSNLPILVSRAVGSRSEAPKTLLNPLTLEPALYKPPPLPFLGSYLPLLLKFRIPNHQPPPPPRFPHP